MPSVEVLSKLDPDDIIKFDRAFQLQDVGEKGEAAKLLAELKRKLGSDFEEVKTFFHRNSISKLETKGRKPVQKLKNLDELYEQAKVADEELRVITKRVAQEIGGTAKFPPTELKDRVRAIEKIETEYKGDVSRITDLSRSSIEFEEIEDVYKALNKITEDYEVIRIKDRFKKPAPSGYRDILINVKMSNSHIVEIQLHLKSILEAKELETQIYNEIRAIKSLAKKEGRSLTTAEIERISNLQKQSCILYENALSEL